MVWNFFGKKHLNSVDIGLCNPIIVNQTEYSIVVFLDRGMLYNKQVLLPGEAVGMTRQETAGTIVPYRIHAVIGDEKGLPTKAQSMKNLLSTLVIPTAFICGTLMAASSAGTLTGPSAALSRVAGGVVVKGMVIDSAALAAGSLAASRASFVAEKIIEKYPEKFAIKSGLCLPGKQFVVVRGGVETTLTLTFLSEKAFRQTIAIDQYGGAVKAPMDTIKDKVEYYTPKFLKSTTNNKIEEVVDLLIDEQQQQQEQQQTQPIQQQQQGKKQPPAAKPGSAAVLY